MFTDCYYCPEPDLLIRTSGEQRGRGILWCCLKATWYASQGYATGVAPWVPRSQTASALVTGKIHCLRNRLNHRSTWA